MDETKFVCKILVGSPEWQRPTEEIREMGWDDVFWADMAQDRVL